MLQHENKKTLGKVFHSSLYLANVKGQQVPLADEVLEDVK